VQALDPGARLATVNGEAITADDVERALAAPLRNLEEQIYLLKRQTLEALIGDRLLAAEAAKRGMSVQALLDAEVTGKTATVSDQQVDAAYQAAKEDLGGDEATARDQLRAKLRNQMVAARRAAFISSLRTEGSVVVNLKAPPPFKPQVTSEGAPFRGSATAPVTIVEFSDFHCSFCKRVLPTLNELMAKYGDTVKLAFRDFPLDGSHPLARRAAEAARCARDQEKFWEYHDLLFANAPKASQDQLKAYAEEVAIDIPKFERCLASSIHAAAVQKDFDEGIRSGVTGTPTFFVNGRVLAGALPVEAFTRVIDEELKQARSEQDRRQRR
jgi:protein-disulfide isomerase